MNSILKHDITGYDPSARLIETSPERKPMMENNDPRPLREFHAAEADLKHTGQEMRDSNLQN